MKSFKIYTVFLFFLSISLLSCVRADEVVVPDDVLSSESMAEVMVDIHLLEATMNINAGVSAESVPSNLDIYSKHNITKEQYERSFVFYTEHPEIFGEVYQLVLNNLSKKQAEVVQGK